MRNQLALGLILGLGGAAWAQQGNEPPKADPPAQPPAKQEDPAIPSLDEALGLTRPSDKPRAEDAERSKGELKERLTAQQASEAFEQAVRLMGDAAGRLRAARDTGLTTQRIQEDIIKKLDALISAADRQQSSSSSSSSQQQQQDQRQRQQPNQAQSNQNAGNRENVGEAEPPGREDGPLGPEMAPGALWGALPPRVREALRQAQDERFSAMYKAATEAYYRRLAEEAKK